MISNNRVWSLIASNEANDTTDTDKKTSTEVYTSVADGGTKIRGKAYTADSAAVDGGVDTKNTAGSTNTSSKIYLIGATSQTTSSQTYSDSGVFTTGGVLSAKTLEIGATTAVNHIKFKRDSYCYLGGNSASSMIALNPTGDCSAANSTLVAATDAVFPGTNNTINLGKSSQKWATVYATTFDGAATAIKDSGNGNSISVAYSKAGLDSATWLAAWNGYELRAIASSKFSTNILVGTAAPTASQGANGDIYFQISS